MPICPSSICPSVRQDWGEGGRGLSQKCFSNFFSFFWHGASLGWHKSHIERYIWLNRSKGNFSRSVRSNLALFALGGHLLQNCSVTFSLFYHRVSQEGYQWTAKRRVWLNRSKCPFSRSEGRIWPLLTYLSMLFNSTKVLPSFIAPCSFIGVMSMLSENINDVESL